MALELLEKIPYDSIQYFSFRDQLYAKQDAKLRPFITHFPTAENIGRYIAQLSFDKAKRQVLHEALGQQYANRKTHAAVWANLNLLAENDTFTVTCAHQPSLFLGPLYNVYKILNTIRLAKDLNEKYKTWRFVPVYWNGGEDHDFQEVNHLDLFKNHLEWQTKQSGSVADFAMDAALDELVNQLAEIVGDKTEGATQLMATIKSIYRSDAPYTYGEAHSLLLNELFGHLGLVVINPWERALKKLFAGVMIHEIAEQSSFNCVMETTQKIEKLGLKVQATPREINLFYKNKGIRERLVKNQAGGYQVLNSDINWTEDELKALIYREPELFSPNVVLRPLYQATILPDIIFVGGGAEVAYWMERFDLFAFYKTAFPILVRRSSAQVLEASTYEKWQKLGFSFAKHWQFTNDELIKNYLDRVTSGSLSLDKEKTALIKIFDAIAQKAQITEPTLVATTEAERQKQLKVLEQLESRLMRAEKQKNEQALSQIRLLKQKLTPNDALQERFESFMPLYAQSGVALFDQLLTLLDPMERSYFVLLNKV